jgi:predicted nucleic acid-binding Zn ribbon protein
MREKFCVVCKRPFKPDGKKLHTCSRKCSRLYGNVLGYLRGRYLFIQR